ncbi:centromere protein H [Aspergillus glaucus CBS 516.65]|uniref:Centromere protein H C-terminal domain-containing protein n=1 Tax=Aspergillus glaucus CBS 516.65 TaxID=1160497 RepID=A0A1L9VNN6_ASPGL|nr:hypothetical protein ASPGLDRAFT_65524 [Aspergillus glaucus CBS 516.65]OJJ85537.1 hypothetical protein ASPGLDRAFT_65524 [Aspergillus glaucus CBS 516.65]
MASSTKVQSLPHLEEGEVSLLELAADDARDVAPLSDKEAMILQLYHRVQEQKLEKALLRQESENVSGENVDEQLAIAEQELLEARATYTVRRKAVGTALMTEPSLKAVHLKATSPAERDLLRLINRRDVLSLAHENLHTAHNATLRQLSNLEVENRQIHDKNRELVRQLLELTGPDGSWRDQLEDRDLRAQLDALDAEQQKCQARWEVIKNVASAIVVGSGVNWADDDKLNALVLDESDD